MMEGEWRRLPLSITWYLTTACNLACEFCYNRTEGPPSDFDLEEARRVLRDIAAAKPFSLCLIGGEIFMLDGLLTLIRDAHNYGIKVNLASNGLLITEAIMDELSTMNIGFIQISLDGSTAELHDRMRGPGTYDKTLAVIRRLKERGFRVDLATIISRPNLHDVVNMMKLGQELGISRVKYNLFIPAGPAAAVGKRYELNPRELRDAFRMIDEYRMANPDLEIEVEKPCFGNFSEYAGRELPEERGFKSYGCQAGTRTATILNTGDVVGCEMFSDEVAGNVYQESFNALWRRNDAFSNWRNPEPLKGKCNSCSVFSVCGGGCRANAVLYKNDFFASDPLCWFGPANSPRLPDAAADDDLDFIPLRVINSPNIVGGR